MNNIQINAMTEIEERGAEYAELYGCDKNTAQKEILRRDPELRHRYAFGESMDVKSYYAETLPPARQAMNALAADSVMTKFRAGTLLDHLAKKEIVNVGRGVALPVEEYRRALITIGKRFPNLQRAALDGYIADDDWTLLAMLVPSVAGEVGKGRYHRFESAPDVRVYRDDLPTVALPAIEIFSVGRWNSDVYSAEDLDAMVSAFSELRDSWEPVAKAGHEDGQQKDGATRRLFGAPALGYVSRLYRSGEKLIADFKDVPRRFAQLIKAGTYKKISSEIFWNYKNPANGKVYPRVLRAVAFLGAEIPAVTNLKEIEALFSVSENGTLYAYDDDENEFRVYYG